jgi:CubicO group peptidase (beta-lactamase class C family)
MKRLTTMLWLLVVVIGARADALANPALLSPAQIRAIVDTYVKSQVYNGSAVGAEVGITLGGKRPQFFSYGLSRFGTQPQDREGFSPDTLFQIGSVTKIFTTNLLGQMASQLPSVLTETLSQFAAQMGTLPTNVGLMTLEELGDFTSGVPDNIPPQCRSPSQSGTGCICASVDTQTGECIANDRPTIEQYDAQNLVSYYQHLQVSPPPGSYFYSDVSTGIVGLLIGGNPKRPLDNGALTGWSSRLNSQLTQPLGMKHTFINPPEGQSALGVAAGYDQALVSPQVTDGQITGFEAPTNPGSNYVQSMPPAVTIVGGAGKGATAHVVLSCPSDPSECTVASIVPDTPGTGYIPTPVATFGSGGPDDAQGDVVVTDGKVLGILMHKRGCYSAPPAVTISGGRQTNGRDAIGQAVLWHEQVAFVEITDGGAGYVEPLAVKVAPGEPFLNNIPIWAPAGALSSTAREMMTLTEAALGHRTADGNHIPPLILDGFKVAETSYAEGGTSCGGAEIDGSGLAWGILPPDDSVGEIIVKNGGVGGFSTVVYLVPSIDLGIVVFVNSRSGKVIAELNGQPTSIATDTGFNLIFAILHTMGTI